MRVFRRAEMKKKYEVGRAKIEKAREFFAGGLCECMDFWYCVMFWTGCGFWCCVWFWTGCGFWCCVWFWTAAGRGSNSVDIKGAVGILGTDARGDKLNEQNAICGKDVYMSRTLFIAKKPSALNSM